MRIGEDEGAARDMGGREGANSAGDAASKFKESVQTVGSRSGGHLGQQAQHDILFFGGGVGHSSWQYRYSNKRRALTHDYSSLASPPLNPLVLAFAGSM